MKIDNLVLVVFDRKPGCFESSDYTVEWGWLRADGFVHLFGRGTPEYFKDLVAGFHNDGYFPEIEDRRERERKD